MHCSKWCQSMQDFVLFRIGTSSSQALLDWLIAETPYEHCTLCIIEKKTCEPDLLWEADIRPVPIKNLMLFKGFLGFLQRKLRRKCIFFQNSKFHVSEMFWNEIRKKWRMEQPKQPKFQSNTYYARSIRQKYLYWFAMKGFIPHFGIFYHTEKYLPKSSYVLFFSFKIDLIMIEHIFVLKYVIS